MQAGEFSIPMTFAALVADGEEVEPLTFASSVLLAIVPMFVRGRLPVTPVVNGSPVAFVRTAADGVPSAGVVSVGEVARIGI